MDIPLRKASKLSIPNALDLPFERPCYHSKGKPGAHRYQPSKLCRVASAGDLLNIEEELPREEKEMTANMPYGSFSSKKSDHLLGTHPGSVFGKSPLTAANHRGDERPDWSTFKSNGTVMKGSATSRVTIAPSNHEPTPPYSGDAIGPLDATFKCRSPITPSSHKSALSELGFISRPDNILSPVSPPDPDVVEALQQAQLAEYRSAINAQTRELAASIEDCAIESYDTHARGGHKYPQRYSPSLASPPDPDVVAELERQSEVEAMRPDHIIRGGFDGVNYPQETEFKDFYNRMGSARGWFRFPMPQVTEEFLPKGMTQHDWDLWLREARHVDGSVW